MPKRKGEDSTSRPLSHAAQEARLEISKHAWGIDGQLEDLSEDDLKAVAHHIRKHDSDPISLFAATVADRKLEIMERHRTGGGAWFAVVQAIKWNPLDKFGKTDFLASVKCEARPAALSMARQMLVEHAAKISENVTVEGKVISELDDEAEGLKA